MHERLADFDYRGLGKVLRPRLTADGRGWTVCGHAIGVTASDLSRICNGQPVSAGKVIAVCDWLGVSFRAFYVAPLGPLVERASPSMLHGESTEMEGARDG